MFQFVWYQHDWKEPFDAEGVSYWLQLIQGKAVISTLEPGGDAYEYCIHTEGLSSKTVARVSEAKAILEGTNIESGIEQEWFQTKYDWETGILTLEDEVDIEILCEYATDIDIQERHQDQVRHSLLQSSSTQAQKPYYNQSGRVWQIMNRQGYFYDVGIPQFVPKTNGTTCFPLYQLAEKIIRNHQLKSVSLVTKQIDKW